MIIKGIQKLTLLDYPGRTACTVFTPGCDFRCPFCHNASLVLEKDDEKISTDDVLALLKKRRGVLTGIAITGGEPLMQPGLIDFMKKIRDIGYSIKLDTNGSFPAKLSEIFDLGLVDYVAMDIKNCREKYAATCGLPESSAQGLLESIQTSIDMIRSRAREYEFRTTVVRELHSAEDIERMGIWMQSSDRFFLQCFVDSGDILKPGLGSYTKEEMTALLEIFRRFVPTAQVRGL